MSLVYYLQKFYYNPWKSVRTYTGKDRIIVLVRQLLLKCNCTVSEIDRLKTGKELNAEVVYYKWTSFHIYFLLCLMRRIITGRISEIKPVNN